MFYTIIGTQWGDEGKGKIVDWLASKVDIVVRFQGGNNAGHTLQIKNNIYKLNLIPSGVVRGKMSIIGNGVVLDPWALSNEINKLSSQGVNINSKNFKIAENVCLILPIHKALDEIDEMQRGEENLGTTKKGIGPAYEDKVGRRAIRLCDLNNTELLKNKINVLLQFHFDRIKNNPIKNLDLDILFNKDKIINDLKQINNKLYSFAAPVWKLINEMGNTNKSVLFEGAQGSLLDVDFGTYPYVTSSNTTSGQIFAGSGFGIRNNHKILGVTKAYTTRVGAGPFPTEQINSTGDYLGDKGKEYGTVTKRKRRCGWFDVNLVNQSVKINGIDNLILTKLDILDDLEEIKICTGYLINKKKYDYLPANEIMQLNIIPVYESLEGWKSSTFGLTRWSDLPKDAKKYISTIEELIQTKISVVSTGPERTQTIDRENIL